MKIIMNYVNGKKLFEKEELSQELLEELLILGHFFELQDLIWLATDQVFFMIDNPSWVSTLEQNIDKPATRFWVVW